MARFSRRPKSSGSLFDPTKVDLITREPSGTIKLVVVQDQPWIGSEAETESLLAKIANYARYAQSGALPDASARWTIVIDTYCGPPPQVCRSALHEAAEKLRAIGSDLRLHEMSMPGRDDDVPASIQDSAL